MADKKVWLSVALIVLVLAGALAGAVVLSQQPKKTRGPISPVPASISHAVNFKVYYPDQSKLPVGYIFDKNSFANPVKNGISYSVNYGNGSKIVFSLQTKPSDNELQTFNGNFIPLRIDIQTPLGQAESGVYREKTLASLPITNGPWVVVTAPKDINQQQLKQILSSLKAD
jgi:hypothetical protein